MSRDPSELQLSYVARDRSRPLGLVQPRQGSALGGCCRPGRPCCLPEESVEAFNSNAHAPEAHANWLALFGGAQDLPSQIHPDWKHFSVVLTRICSWNACRCTSSLTHLCTPNLSKHHARTTKSTQSAGRSSYIPGSILCVRDSFHCTKHVCELERKQRWVDYHMSGTSCDCDDGYLNAGCCAGDFGAIAVVPGSAGMCGEELFHASTRSALATLTPLRGCTAVPVCAGRSFSTTYWRF